MVVFVSEAIAVLGDALPHVKSQKQFYAVKQ
jgi:hypothetical protein